MTKNLSKKVVIDPIAEFMQEHDLALKQLYELNDAIKKISHNGFSKEYFKVILKSVKYMKNEVSIHNGKEEKVLFPILEKYVEGPTQIMRDEHKYLKKKFLQFEDVVKNLKEKSDKKLINHLISLSKIIIKIFVNHIHKENYILFPFVSKFLSKEELRKIAKKIS